METMFPAWSTLCLLNGIQRFAYKVIQPLGFWKGMLSLDLTLIGTEDCDELVNALLLISSICDIE